MINFFNKCDVFKVTNKTLLRSWIRDTILDNSRKVGDINIIYCTDPYLLEMNNKYLHHNYFTDVITFDTSDYFEKNDKISGDIFISIDTVKANALEYNTTFDEEFHRVTIHGVLHLLGFDDLNEEQSSEMRKMENKYLEKFYSQC